MMSIAIGSKYRGEQETVEVFDVIDYRSRIKSISFETVIFIKNYIVHVLTKDDFLRQYKPYEPVYEWKWAFKDNKTYGHVQILEYKTESEFIEWQSKADATLEYQRLDFTKQERI